MIVLLILRQFSTEKMDDTEEKEIQYILEEKAILEKKLQEIGIVFAFLQYLLQLPKIVNHLLQKKKQ